MTNLNDLLEQMKQVNAALEITRIDYEAKRDEIMATVQDALDDLDAEYQLLLQDGQTRLSALEAEAKAGVIAAGSTAKIDGVQVVYVKGRVSWDTKSLDGYAAAHPEIEQFRKEGNPSARVKWG